jgi:predicted nucleotidyltransferase
MTTNATPYCSVPLDVYEKATDYIIFTCRVGSELYGLSDTTTDSDIDLMSVTIMPPSDVLGIAPFEGLEYRTAGKGNRSRPGDIDHSIYSLRKYLRLASDGNPSILAPLFAPRDRFLFYGSGAAHLFSNRNIFLSKKAGYRHLGYARSQRERMVDSRAGVRSPRVNRPELFAKYGFDPKFAAHMLRLTVQGTELMRHGVITLPMPETERDQIRAVRRGEVSYEEILEAADHFEHVLEAAIRSSDLPDTPDRSAVDKLSYSLHYTSWMNHANDKEGSPLA